MQESVEQRSSRPVAIWLLVGIAMIVIQVLLGGITRLTGSGLSITEWKPIMGALPPLNEADWAAAFEKYKQIGQYKYLNAQFTLSDFKFIFFWEWFHRLWARLIGVAFIIPFVVFLIQKRFRPSMVRPMIILFLLGALQGLVGWIMVQSGLEDSEAIYVSHYKLAIHLVLALGLLCYTLWFAMELLVPRQQLRLNSPVRKFTLLLLVLVTVQLVYGAFLAGLKAAKVAPTWPRINGEWIPAHFRSFAGHSFPGLQYLTANPLVIHFIHRNLAYLITILLFAWWWKARQETGSLFGKLRLVPPILVSIQVILGIFTVLNPFHPTAFLWLGVAHQLVAMLLLLSIVAILFLIRPGRSLPGREV